MRVDVIFERKCGDRWEPTTYSSLAPGDEIRMKDTSGGIIDEGKVENKRGSDPDSHVNYDLCVVSPEG